MPNWFIGRLTLRSDDTEKMKELEMFVKMNVDENGDVEDDCKVGDKFTHKFCPLDWTEIPDDVGTITDDGTRWDFHVANQQWGSKWGTGRVITLDFDKVEGLRMRYNSAWNMPQGLFEQLVDKGYEVFSYGHCDMDHYEYFNDGNHEGDEIYIEDILAYLKTYEYDDDDVDMEDTDAVWDYCYDHIDDYLEWLTEECIMKNHCPEYVLEQERMLSVEKWKIKKENKSVQQYIYDVVVCDDNGENIHDQTFNNRQDAIEYCNANGISSDKVRCFGRSEYWMEADEEEREHMILSDAWDWDTEVEDKAEPEPKDTLPVKKWKIKSK